ncbi:hypothetical protein OIU79_016558 [Salix purpurea]|uniref:Uncharacterized protein n=1 Tax=Salix purpurea TaxID=77065 RepID=A0A9Q0PEL3_SALPP|nr:hypothetical protein OIU79_016558 [Salix purpurea]
MVQLDQPIRPYEDRWHRPVNLPLPGAGGYRCSVKPASRIAPRFRSSVTQAFAWVTRLSSWFGTGKPEISHTRLGHLDRINVHITLMPPLGSQAHATELGESNCFACRLYGLEKAKV